VFTGIAHSSTQNTRGLPLVWRDAGVVQDSYSYGCATHVAVLALVPGIARRAPAASTVPPGPGDHR
jgi:hypothetical protein